MKLTEDEKMCLDALMAVSKGGVPDGCSPRILEGLMHRDFLRTEDEKTWTLSFDGESFLLLLVRKRFLEKKSHG